MKHPDLAHEIFMQVQIQFCMFRINLVCGESVKTELCDKFNTRLIGSY
jgi:hypothetical protein